MRMTSVPSISCNNLISSQESTMTEENQHNCYVHKLPNEILIYLFNFLPAKDLVKQRQVCRRWKYVIDEIASGIAVWQKYCAKDFGSVIESASEKASLNLSWYDLYRSLSLWPKLLTAQVTRDEFAFASDVVEQILDINMLQYGDIGVLRNNGITYYNIYTLRHTNHRYISGSYLRYAENEDTIVLMSFHEHLFVIRKYIYSDNIQSNVTFEDVKVFLLHKHFVYFVDVHNYVYKCNLTHDQLTAERILQAPGTVMSMGFKNCCLNLLTFERNIYIVKVDGTQRLCTYACELGPDSNLAHRLYEFNLLEQMDWRVFIQWMYVWNRTVPQGPMHHIVTVKSYGDMVFVGTAWGVLRLYLSPFTGGELDFLNAEPILQFNFMERSDCPVLSMCPIISIDIVEIENGHIIIVAMPKKIASLKFVHNFERMPSFALVPYNGYFYRNKFY